MIRYVYRFMAVLHVGVVVVVSYPPQELGFVGDVGDRGQEPARADGPLPDVVTSGPLREQTRAGSEILKDKTMHGMENLIMKKDQLFVVKVPEYMAFEKHCQEIYFLNDINGVKGCSIFDKIFVFIPFGVGFFLVFLSS